LIEVMVAKSEPLVSVIVATYNQAGTSGRAVESVLNQTYPRLDIVLVDNGSTDDTVSVLTAFGSDPRVRLFSFASNEPVTQRLNFAVNQCKGEFLSLLYGDDFYLPQKIALQVATFDQLDEDFGVVYTPGFRWNTLTDQRWIASGPTQTGDLLVPLLKSLRRGEFINPISPLMRRACFLQHQFYEDLFFESEAQYLRIATTHKFFYVDEPTVVMTDHDRNVGKALRSNGANTETLLLRLRELPTFPENLYPLVDDCLVSVLVTLGWQGIRVIEDGRWSRLCFRKAMAVQLRAVTKPKVLIGWVLSWLPPRLMHWINLIGYRIKPPKEWVVYHDE
jgi:glycosyltransferase involved in cell wall biosynthesis